MAPRLSFLLIQNSSALESNWRPPSFFSLLISFPSFSGKVPLLSAPCCKHPSESYNWLHDSPKRAWSSGQAQSSTIVLQSALGQVALSTRISWKALSLIPACSGLGPQMVLDAGAPKCKSVNYCNPCILHASVQGARGKSVLHETGPFIFSVTRHDVVGNGQMYCAKRNVRFEDPYAQHSHQTIREESFPGMLHPCQGAVIEIISNKKRSWKLQMLLKQQLLI